MATATHRFVLTDSILRFKRIALWIIAAVTAVIGLCQLSGNPASQSVQPDQSMGGIAGSAAISNETGIARHEMTLQPADTVSSLPEKRHVTSAATLKELRSRVARLQKERHRIWKRYLRLSRKSAQGIANKRELNTIGIKMDAIYAELQLAREQLQWAEAMGKTESVQVAARP